MKASQMALAIMILSAATSGAPSHASGTWTQIVSPEPTSFSNMLLLSDGTVIGADGGSNWYRLTPDIHGSYVNGTWTQIASMIDTRLYYSIQLLPSGKVYVGGGEYGTGTGKAEVYDPVANVWTATATPPFSFTDAESQLLPDGTVLESNAQSNTAIYNPVTNTWSTPISCPDQNEACWTKLADDSILTIDAYGQSSSRYIPSLGQWVSDATVPVAVYGYGGELGSSHLLPNGNVFQIGAAPNTAIYTPTGNSNPGSWVAGPVIPNNLGAVDAPAAMMTSGTILCALGDSTSFGTDVSFYEYDYTTNAFTQVNGPTGVTDAIVPYATSMLDLPDGSVLYQGTGLYEYTPSGTPLAAGKPVISSVTQNADGSYHLVGTGLNGISQGAKYGDDKQMDSNYPIVRLTSTSTGNVYYAKTYGWSSTSVMTGSKSMSTEFTLPTGLPTGSYSLVAVANGNPSAAFAFSTSTESAYGGTPWAIPGTIQNENYDLGGEGVAYHDSDTVNSGGQYRTDGVDIEACTDTGGGYDVGWTNAGEYLKYTVNVATAGSYTATFRVASGASGGSFHVEDQNGTNLTGTVTAPGTGGWQTWTSVTATVTLAAGQQILKLVEDTGGYNLNYMSFAAAGGESPYGGTPWPIPGTVQAENYDLGGEGVAYHDVDAANQGGQYRTDGVDIEACTDTGGGYDVGWTNAGEYLKYTVNVATAGTYTVSFRVASGGSGGTFHLENQSGTNLTGTVTVPGTGGWQTWATVTATATLAAGQQIIKLVEDSAGYNINYLTFASSTSSPTFINCGGSAASPYVADIDFSSGTEAATTNAIDTSLLASPIPPQAVLQTERYGNCTYTIPGYTPGSSHTIILYFAENYWNAVGQRTFNVTINGAQLLTNFDIFAATGAQFKAIQQSFNSNANSSGQYVITLTTVVDNAKIDGIAIN